MSFLTAIQSVKGAVRRNLATKVFALALTVLLWFHVVTGRSYEWVVQIPLRVKNVPGKMVIANQLPSKIAVKFFGEGRQLLRLPHSETAVTLKLTSHRPGVRKYRLSPANVEVIGLKVKPREIVRPKTVTVQLDRLVTKSLKVIPHVRLQLTNGYVQVGSIKTTPEKVKVWGPRKFLKKVNSVALDSLSFSRVKEKINTKVKVIPPEGINIGCFPSTVNLSIDIQPLGERWIRNIPVGLKYLPKGQKVRIEPPTIDIKLQGGIDLLAGLTPKDISAYIDYRKVRRGKRVEVPAIISPKTSEVELIEAKPERFTVIVE